MTNEQKKPPKIYKTADQKISNDGFPKAVELVEMKPSQELSLQDGRIFNALIENAVAHISEDIEHEIAVNKGSAPAECRMTP